MGLSRSPDVIRLAPDDPVPGFLGSKVQAGAGITISRKIAPGIGHQAIFTCDSPVHGSQGSVHEMKDSGVISNCASLVLINAADNPVEVTFPHPAEVVGWFSIVCVDNSHPITFKSSINEDDKVFSPDEGIVVDTKTQIFDRSNIEFHAAGDSLMFASNRKDTWYCIGKYAANWY